MRNSKAPETHRFKVVIVAMADSVHVSRWLQVFKGLNVDFHLVSSSPHRRIHPGIKELLNPKDGTSPYVSMNWTSQYLSLLFWIMDRFASDKVRGFIIKKQILRYQPDAVHAIEFQNAGYATLRAYESLSEDKRPKLYVTNYGSDIYWFGRQSGHTSRITNLLRIADVYLCECQRDVDLALEFGFQGEIWPVHPNTGGITYEQYSLGLQSNPPSERTTIALKGYQGKFGRANEGLQALALVLERLPEFQAEIFSANSATKRAVRALPKAIQSRIEVHDKHSLTHDEILELFRRSRVYCGLSISDGISTSMLEAMSQGCFPIQTCTACANEWIIDGRDGFIVNLGEVNSLAQRIQSALENDELVDRAKSSNSQTIYSRYLLDRLKPEIVTLYS